MYHYADFWRGTGIFFGTFIFFILDFLIWSLVSTVKDEGCAQKGCEFSQEWDWNHQGIQHRLLNTLMLIISVPVNQWSEMKKYIYVTPSLSHFFLLICEVREQNIFPFPNFLQLLETKQSFTEWSTENRGRMVVVFFSPKHMIPDTNHQWKKGQFSFTFNFTGYFTRK